MAASNWDVSLHEQLERTGLRPLLDGAVSSAEVGAAKPDPAILVRALEIAGAEPAHAWHVGDDLEADVGAARAAGLRPVLIDRDGRRSTRRPGCSASPRWPSCRRSVRRVDRQR